MADPQDQLPPLSVLDLVPIAAGDGPDAPAVAAVGEAVEASVELARQAETHGYRRVWYAEHHNMATIGSSATAVLIAHVAARTSTITLGAGGVMLPNHSPLVVAEQFGTLASIHPGRIELGLGRAPGTDQVTMRAMRRDPMAADTFPQDVVELAGYLGDTSPVPGARAVPGRGTHVPLYILGSSLFGARLAAALGLPYAFASHFAPDALHQAIATYRREFRPAAQGGPGEPAGPRVLAGVNVVAADSTEQARAELHRVTVARVQAFSGRAGQPLTQDEAEAALRSGAAASIAHMLSYVAAGTPSEVADYLRRFRAQCGADELVVVHQATSTEQRLRSVRLTAEAFAG
jgi:luciferase family oxidoreductase group 1